MSDVRQENFTACDCVSRLWASAGGQLTVLVVPKRYLGTTRVRTLFPVFRRSDKLKNETPSTGGSFDETREKAKAGDAKAQFELGWMCLAGKGVEQDYKKAVKWYRRAAEQGDASAQNNLGLMYVNGQSVAQNYKEAYIWYSIAAGNGYKRSAKCRDDVAKLLSASSLEAAQAEAVCRLEKIRENRRKTRIKISLSGYSRRQNRTSCTLPLGILRELSPSPAHYACRLSREGRV